MDRLPPLTLSVALLLACGSDDSAAHGSGTTSVDGDASSDASPVTSSSSDPSSSAADTESSGEGSSSAATSSGVDTDAALPEAHDDLFETPMDHMLVVDAAAGLFANDVAMDVVVHADSTSERGGTVTVAADGGFTYEPPLGIWGPDSFAYTIGLVGGPGASAVATINVTPVVIPLPSIVSGRGGIVIDGGADDFRTGFSVSGAGDIDGDGRGDFVIGAPYDDGSDDRGSAFVVFGADDLAPIDLDDVTAGVGGFRIDGRLGDRAGWSVRAAGDVDGDGLGDLVLGGEAYNRDGAGLQTTSWVVFGKADGNAVDLDEVAAGNGGFMILGEWSGFASENHCVSGAGDIDGDGLADVLVGIRMAQSTGFARSYLVRGKADGDPVALADVVEGVGGFVLEGEAGESNDNIVGWPAQWLSSAGDVNGDGLADFSIGDRSLSTNAERAGRAYVVFGSVAWQAIALADVAAGQGGFAIDGHNFFDGIGDEISGAGDVNGDGLDDIVLGATSALRHSLNAGLSYVVFGKADTDLVQLSAVAAGDGGFMMMGEEDARVGSSVGGGGDVNGDGLDDVVLGSRAPTPLGSGRTYVVYGRSSTAVIDLADIATGDGGFVIDAATDGDFHGEASAIIDDVDGDLLSDVLIGSHDEDGTYDSAGRSYLVFGTSTAPHRER